MNMFYSFYLIITSDQSGNGICSALIHLMAFSMVISSWIFKRRRGKWQTRKTTMKPMNITAILSSFFLLDSLTEIAAGGVLLGLWISLFITECWSEGDEAITFKLSGFFLLKRLRNLLFQSFLPIVWLALSCPLAVGSIASRFVTSKTKNVQRVIKLTYLNYTPIMKQSLGNMSAFNFTWQCVVSIFAGTFILN